MDIFFEGLNILIITFCLCADGFKVFKSCTLPYCINASGQKCSSTLGCSTLKKTLHQAIKLDSLLPLAHEEIFAITPEREGIQNPVPSLPLSRTASGTACLSPSPPPAWMSACPFQCLPPAKCPSPFSTLPRSSK